MKYLQQGLRHRLNTKIIKLAYPAVLEMMLHMAVGIADIAMVGRLGAEPLAAVSLGSQVFFSVLFLFNAIGIGAAAIVARLIGGRDYEYANFVTAQAMLLAALIGTAVGGIIYFTAPALFGLFPINERVMEMGVGYLQIIALPAAMYLILFVTESITRGSGNTQVPLIVASVATSLNIILNYILIYGKLGFPALGVQGAAIATTCSLIIACLLMLAIVAKGWVPVKLEIKNFTRLDFATIRRIMGLSFPAGGEELMRSSSNIVSIYLISSLGAVAYAAHQVAVTVESLSFMPGYGLAIAASSLVGRSLGAKKIKQAVQVGWRAALIALFSMTIMSILFYFGSMTLVKLFTTDPDVQQIAAMAVTIAAFEQPTIAIYMVFLGVLRGAGDTKWPFIITFIGNWCIRLPLFYLAIHHWDWGVREIWYITVFQWFIVACLASWRFLKGRWREIQV